jgi:hypothetical protein
MPGDIGAELAFADAYILLPPQVPDFLRSLDSEVFPLRLDRLEPFAPVE